jgi:hypothetical protein
LYMEICFHSFFGEVICLSFIKVVMGWWRALPLCCGEK